MAIRETPVYKCSRNAHPRERTGVEMTVAYLVVMLLTVLVRSEALLKLELESKTISPTDLDGWTV